MERYLVTGATGFLGRTVTAELLARGAVVHALVLPNDPLAATLPAGVNTVAGDICNQASLYSLFEHADSETAVIHCAGIVSVASKPGEKLYRVNVEGTQNILTMCAARRVAKLVYVSSVHVIPEAPQGTVMTEPPIVSPAFVVGHYAKSKAAATAKVLEAAKNGLNANVVFPSGIIGPGDVQRGSITHMLLSFLAGKLPLAVQGGYDFVDVRDVADGIVSCVTQGEPGESYILSGHFSSIRDILEVVKADAGLKQAVHCLPIGIAKCIAPFYERWSLRNGRPLYFTPYSIAVLASNGLFSHKAATDAFGYTPRSLRKTLQDTVSWLRGEIRSTSACATA